MFAFASGLSSSLEGANTRAVGATSFPLLVALSVVSTRCDEFLVRLRYYQLGIDAHHRRRPIGGHTVTDVLARDGVFDCGLSAVLGAFQTANGVN